MTNHHSHPTRSSKDKESGTPDILRLSGRLAEGFLSKAGALWDSYKLSQPRIALPFPLETPIRAEEDLRREWSRGRRGNFSDLDGSNADLVIRIKAETERLNLNNITRTTAYWNIFRDNPELHWALLAHMVSRNGGWNMTDLAGQWLPSLLEPHKLPLLFGMLESCNALIFRDAYPQLRLYEESRACGRSRFGLLPAFEVSAFMTPFWERYWIDRNPAALTVALIVNEQHVIEHRVVKDPSYRETVMNSLDLLSQRLLQLTQVLFPLSPPVNRSSGKESGDSWTDSRLAGRVLERFDHIGERIEFGKSLYAMLYRYPQVLRGVIAFAEAVPHTGSRADYWPCRFTPVFAGKQTTGGLPSVEDGPAGCGIESLWRSPYLRDAWPDRPLGPVSEEDWLTDLEPLRYVSKPRPPLVIDMTREHLFGQRKLEAAVTAKQALQDTISLP